MRRLTAILVALLLAAPAAQAESHAASIADGRPWSTVAPTGGTMEITLNPDGTGRMAVGILSRRITWTEQGDMICLGGIPGGAGGCIRFTSVDGGFVGAGPDGQTLQLTR